MIINIYLFYPSIQQESEKKYIYMISRDEKKLPGPCRAVNRIKFLLRGAGLVRMERIPNILLYIPHSPTRSHAPVLSLLHIGSIF